MVRGNTGAPQCTDARAVNLTPSDEEARRASLADEMERRVGVRGGTFTLIRQKKRFGVVWCGLVWFGVVWCGLVWFGVVWCGVVVWCGGLGVVVLGVVVWEWWFWGGGIFVRGRGGLGRGRLFGWWWLFLWEREGRGELEKFFFWRRRERESVGEEGGCFFGEVRGVFFWVGGGF